MRRVAEEVLARGGLAPGVEHMPAADVLSPADRYQELFVAVQSGRVFADSKSFVDCVPTGDPATILSSYRNECRRPEFNLAGFVAQHFVRESTPARHYVSRPGQSLGAHIDGLWHVLTRRPDQHAGRSSLLPLPNDYVTPGGRFGEMYYWDSYFTMIGLAPSGRTRLLRSMADNYSFLIDTHGHIPNGNRTYYLSRSQPPVFALMVGLFERHGVNEARHYLPQLRREYAYWMKGAYWKESARVIGPGTAYRHVVRLPDGSLLNRYWDERETPREEAYVEDVATAAKSPRKAGETYRDLRAGAASGWDFSSRWLGASDDLSTIRTTAILPVDLNSFLYATEVMIANLSAASGDVSTAVEFRTFAAARKRSIRRYLWSEVDGAFFDYDWQLMQSRQQLNGATATPLYVGIASPAEAHRVASALADRLLAPGGLTTTEHKSGQQWDRPNGWAPLQWMAIAGLRRYGKDELAQDIARRWFGTVAGLYERESKIVEKYVVNMEGGQTTGGGGGEYPLQDGFGWTNGIARKLLDEFPKHDAHFSRAGSTKRWL